MLCDQCTNAASISFPPKKSATKNVLDKNFDCVTVSSLTVVNKIYSNIIHHQPGRWSSFLLHIAKHKCKLARQNVFQRLPKTLIMSRGQHCYKCIITSELNFDVKNIFHLKFVQVKKHPIYLRSYKWNIEKSV